MQQRIRTDNYQGIQLTVAVEASKSGMISVINIDGDHEIRPVNGYESVAQAVDAIVRACRVNMDHVSSEYRHALLGGWAVTFSSPIGEDGQLTVIDRWLLRKLVNRCPTFQTAWTPIANSGRVVRISRNREHARFQLADETQWFEAQTYSLENVTLPTLLEHLSCLTTTAPVEYAAS